MEDLFAVQSGPAEPTEESTEHAPEPEIKFEDEQGEAAVEWEHLPPEREFFATPYDPPVKALVGEIRDKELDIRPSFQRYAVWDRTRKSKFIESLLLNIPIPTLFFAEDEDGSKVVVDGQQRLLAVKEFLENQYELRGLEVLSGLNDKRFDELNERQQKLIRNRTLRCLIISARRDSEIRFQVFERLNQGGLVLNAQEVRHCIYRGPLNDLLHSLVIDPAWLTLLGLKVRHPRMNDCELLLRFFAIRASLPDYAPPLKTLLNDYMKNHRKADGAEIAQLTEFFYSAIKPVAAVFDLLPFRRVFKDKNGKVVRDRSLNRAVFDVQMLVMEGLDPKWAAAHKEEIMAAFIVLCLEDQNFADSLSRATADKSRLELRLATWKAKLVELGADLPALSRLP